MENYETEIVQNMGAPGGMLKPDASNEGAVSAGWLDFGKARMRAYVRIVPDPDEDGPAATAALLPTGPGPHLADGSRRLIPYVDYTIRMDSRKRRIRIEVPLPGAGPALEEPLPD